MFGQTAYAKNNLVSLIIPNWEIKMFNHNDNNILFAFILYGCVIIYTYPIFMSTLTQHFIGAICLFRYLYTPGVAQQTIFYGGGP